MQDECFLSFFRSVARGEDSQVFIWPAIRQGPCKEKWKTCMQKEKWRKSDLEIILGEDARATLHPKHMQEKGRHRLFRLRGTGDVTPDALLAVRLRLYYKTLRQWVFWPDPSNGQLWIRRLIPLLPVHLLPWLDPGVISVVSNPVHIFTFAIILHLGQRFGPAVRRYDHPGSRYPAAVGEGVGR